jgi:hypothetical protein
MDHLELTGVPEGHYLLSNLYPRLAPVAVFMPIFLTPFEFERIIIFHSWLTIEICKLTFFLRNILGNNYSISNFSWGSSSIQVSHG